jgi:hypothetical protein
MPYDIGLETRIDEFFAEARAYRKKKMFGGICYLKCGNMAFGIWKDRLIVRCGLARYTECLRKKHVGLFDITGKAMAGWVMVEPDGFEEDRALKAWLKIGDAFASTLVPK